MRFRTVVLLALALFFSSLTFAARADTSDAMKRYGAAMSSVRSYHADIDTGKQTVSMDLALPDRMHIYGAKGGPEAIMIKADAWIKMGDRWQKLPSGGGMTKAWASPADSSRPPTDIDKDYTVADLGIKDTYHAYQLRPKNGGEVITLFLRPDSLPAKIILTGKDGTTTAVYSNFNNVTVEAPK